MADDDNTNDNSTDDDPFDENDPTFAKARESMRQASDKVEEMCKGPPPPLEHALWVVDKIARRLKVQGSFRDLIYGLMGYGPEAYVSMLFVGAMDINNAILEWQEWKADPGVKRLSDILDTQTRMEGVSGTRVPRQGTSEHKALKAAVQALYFADSADYGSALWAVVRELSDAKFVNLLEEDERKAYEIVTRDEPKD